MQVKIYCTPVGKEIVLVTQLISFSVIRTASVVAIQSSLFWMFQSVACVSFTSICILSTLLIVALTELKFF